MVQLIARFANGRSVAFEVDEGLSGSAYFALSMRKCGSSIFNNICTALALENGVRAIDVGATLFDANFLTREWQSDPALTVILRPGNLYGGFRDMPLAWANVALFVESPKVMMVRDPRDALVSEYFSNAYSHMLPSSSGGGPMTAHIQNLREAALRTEIDDSVKKNAPNMLRPMMHYEGVVRMATTKILKYEDYIFRKEDLILEISSSFGWKVNQKQIDEILSWADVRPTSENPREFIRKVTPGDHREKLLPETILELNRILAPAMELFGY